MKAGEYHYCLRGRNFVIYRCDYSRNGHESSSPVRDEPVYYNKEEARKRVYELNGWPYKPKKP